MACFLLSFSVTSFLCRRREADAWQSCIFTVSVSIALVLGQAAGADVPQAMMLYGSWAACIAMLASVAGLQVRTAALEGRRVERHAGCA